MLTKQTVNKSIVAIKLHKSVTVTFFMIDTQTIMDQLVLRQKINSKNSRSLQKNL